MLILALESSTTSAKAMLYSTTDGVLDIKTKEYLPEHNDVKTQDPDGVFMETVELGKAVADNHEIDCIVLGGAWHSVFLCDKDMKPQTKVFSWANTSAAKIADSIRENKEDVLNFYKTTGCMVNAIYPAFKLMYFKEQGYNLEDYYIFGQGSYNTYRLTGRRVVTDSMASGSGLLNIHTKKYEPSILEQIGIKEDQLCEIITYRDTLPLSKVGAELLGLKEGIPVISPCADGALNQVGAGALEEGIMTFSVGTSAAIRLSTDRPIIPDEPSTWCYLSPVMWLSGAATSGATNCIDWFKDNFYDISFTEIEENSQDLDDTPVFLPFLFGERCPGWEDGKRGGFVAIEPHYTNVEFYQAIQEGILFNVYQCYEVLTKLNGKPKKIMLSGGILKSKYWTQMCADIFQAEMETPEMDQASLMGAIVLASEQVGAISDPREFKFPEGEIIKPNPDKADFYKKKYEKYLYWYNRISN